MTREKAMELQESIIDNLAYEVMPETLDGSYCISKNPGGHFDSVWGQWYPDDPEEYEGSVDATRVVDEDDIREYLVNDLRDGITSPETGKTYYSINEEDTLSDIYSLIPEEIVSKVSKDNEEAVLDLFLDTVGVKALSNDKEALESETKRIKESVEYLYDDTIASVLIEDAA